VEAGRSRRRRLPGAGVGETGGECHSDPYPEKKHCVSIQEVGSTSQQSAVGGQQPAVSSTSRQSAPACDAYLLCKSVQEHKNTFVNM